MICHFEPTGNVDEFGKELEWFAANASLMGLIILSCAGNNYKPEDIDPMLANITKPLTGGMFPGIIFENQKYEKGSIFLGLEQAALIYTLKNLNSGNNSTYKMLQHVTQRARQQQTQVVFVDGYSNRISELMENLFLVNGIECNYIGGGAGSLKTKDTPCIFTNKGLLADAATIAIIDTPVGIGVRHGWKTIAGPFMVTSSEKNIVKTINNQPAFKVYKQVLENLTHKIIDENNFFELAKAYPFGMLKFETERIIRDPVSVNGNGEIICIGEVPKGTFLDIMHGDKTSLINAVKEAHQVSKEGYGSQKRNFTFFIDCISRVLFLGDSFNEELDVVYEAGILLIGALTIGEIANTGMDFIEFYNKTSVVGSF